ncbi:hypothetical protein [Enterococcus sp. DIV0660C]|uniref:hypothetical protein n=1 Tax=Enterococcus sp. DIV0660C TaxID=2230880 RepID=UPI001A8E13FB|nr:hypothetical protein [Enterococcus sp. DIV0660C]MBO0432098.1 hypothetical protein [Enterococcus sp. DIV0660C]
MSKKELIIAAISPEKYVKFDRRSLKPIYLTETDENIGAVVEELDHMKVDNLKEKIEFIPPNGISIQLSIVDECINKLKKLKMSEEFRKNKADKILKERVYNNSEIIYEQISLVEMAIVFGYTALETFSNLSIPEDYEYYLVNNKQIKETYNREAIERWIPLDEKISKILPEVYGTSDIKKKNLWNQFKIFENYRHEIIHQKNIERTSFYKKYFRNNIYTYLKVPRQIIEFYYSETTKLGKTNPLWPWMGEGTEIIPSMGGAKEFFSQSEVIGNLFEGKME